jgi:mitochondrial distribution and morphology protein 31
MKGKLFSHLWESASPFSAVARQHPFATHIAIHQDFGRRAFSQTIPELRLCSQRQRSQKTGTRNFASSSISPSRLNSTVILANPIICRTFTGETLCIARAVQLGNLSRPKTQVCYKAMHSSSQRRKKDEGQGQDVNSLADIQNPTNSADGIKNPGQPNPATRQPENDTGGKPPDVQESYSYFHLPHLPKMPHRPTKEEFLAAATGFWSRLRVRFKWFSIRSMRPWNIDDWSAFVSWFIMGHIVWVLIGTTTFFSLLIFTINTVVAQGRALIVDCDDRLLISSTRNLG